MTNCYENLRQFLGGYFHQDWDLEGDSDAAVAALFVQESSREVLKSTILELDELIRQCSMGKKDADIALNDLWCYYYYQADGLTGLEWLIKLREFLVSNSK